ncbi:MAG: 2OG-Fe(II) oxygenase [Bacteroidota bacterium]
MNSEIKSTSHLAQEDIIQLVNRNILALRIYPFENQATCSRWIEGLKDNSMLHRYSNALDVPVNRIGMTLFETEAKPSKIKQYLTEGRLTRPRIRSIFGEINPLDQLLKKINRAWSEGCQIQKLATQQMNPGIIRSFETANDSGLPPHVDSLLKDLPDNQDFEDMKCQLAANLYFDVSEDGGELEIWNYEPNKTELASLFSGSYDFIDRTKIPTPSQLIKPKIGELIIFRSSCIHSVTKIECGQRSAASCFIGFYDTARPLSIWA